MRSPDILSLRGRAASRRLTAEASVVALCLALVNPALGAQQQNPPTPPAPAMSRAPDVEPAPPTATLSLDPVAEQPPDSVALGQPFHIRLSVPADWQPGRTVTATLTNGDRQETLLLTQVDTTPGFVIFSTPAPASIGRAVAGSSDPSTSFSIAYQGTIMGLDQLSNGESVTISLTGFRGPQTTASLSFPVFDNPIEQNIWRIERALTVLEAITKQQQADAAWVLSQSDLPDDVRVEAQALANTAERNAIALGQARSSMAGAGTRLGTLIAGSEYLSLIVKGPGDLDWGNALQDVQRRIVETAGRETIVRDNIANYSTLATLGLYEITRVLTLAGPAYEAGQLALNPALRRLGYDVGAAQSSWGRPITTAEQVFALVELVLAIGLMVGLPRLVDWLAGKTLRMSMNQRPPLPRSQQSARAPGSNPSTTQPLPRSGSGPATRTGPGDTQPLAPGTPPPRIPSTDPAATGVRGGDTAAGNLRQKQAGATDPFAPPPEGAASSPTLRGGGPPAGNRAPMAGGRAPAAPSRVATREAAMAEAQQALGRARQAGVSDEVIDLIWQNSPTVREATTRLRGATTLRNNDVSNGVIADALRVSRTQAEVDELYSVIFEAAAQHGVLSPTLRNVFANAGTREQVIFGIRQQILRAATAELKVEIMRTLNVKDALVQAEKAAKAAGVDLAAIPKGISPEARLDRIVQALLTKRGYSLDVEVGSPEAIRLQEISARTFAKDPQRPNSGGGRLTDEDLVWLADRLAEDPFYFNNLPTRGRYSNGEFTPILDARSAVRLRAAYRDATGGNRFGDYDPIGSFDSLQPPPGGRPGEGQPGPAGGSSAPAGGAPPTPPRRPPDWRALIEAAPTNVGPSPATTPTVVPVPVPSTGTTTSPAGEATTTPAGSGPSGTGTSVSDAGDPWTPIRTRAEAHLAQLQTDRIRLQQAVDETDGSTRDQHQKDLREVDEALKSARSWVALIRWQQDYDRKARDRALSSTPAPAAPLPGTASPSASPATPPAAAAAPAPAPPNAPSTGAAPPPPGSATGPPVHAFGQAVATPPTVASADADLVRAAREAAERDFGQSASDWMATTLADGRVVVVAPDGSKGAIAGVDPAGKVWAASGVPTAEIRAPDRAVGVTAGTAPDALDPGSAALNAELEAELKAAYQNLVAQAKALQGERTISKMPVAEATLVYALLTRNLYAFQLTVHLSRLTQFSTQTREQKIEHIRRLQALAERIEYWWSIRTYLASVPTTEQGQRFLREQADQAGRDEAKRAALLQMAERPEEWSELASTQIYLLADQDPVVGASQDFLARLWSGSPAEELVSFYDEAIAAESAEAQAEITRVRGLNTVEGMSEFFGPQYARTRATAAGMVGSYSANLHGPFEEYARSIAVVQANDRDPLGLNTPMLLGGLIILSLIVPASMPLLLALVAAADVAVAGYGLYHDVPYLLELNAAAANAAAGVGALGYQTVAEMNDQRRIQALGVVMNALGVAVGGRAMTQAVAEARAADMVRRARARAQATLAPDAPAVRENTTGGGTPAAPTDPDWATLDPNRTTIDPGVTVVDPAQTVIDRTQRALTQRDADGAAARAYNRIVNESDVPLSRMEVEAEIRLAREAAVPEDDIAQLTKAFDPIKGSALDNWVIATKLLERRLTHLGYRLNVTREEWVLATQLWFRGRNGRLSPADVAWLQRQVNRDPAFFTNLPKYGKNFQFGHNLMTNTLRPKDGFVPVIDANGAKVLQDAFEAAGGRVPRGAPAGATPPSTARPISGAAATDSLVPVAGLGGAAASAVLGGGSGGVSEQQLADAALDRARQHFNTDGATWRTFVLPDGSVATTSLNQTQRVTAIPATGSDGRPRIHFTIDSIEGTRHVTTRITDYTSGDSSPAERSVLPDLEGPVRPVAAPPTSPTTGRTASTSAAPTTPPRPPGTSAAAGGAPAKTTPRHDIAPITRLTGPLINEDIRWSGRNRVSVMNTDSVNDASVAPGVQSILSVMENSPVMAGTGSSWRQTWALLLFSPPGIRSSFARMLSTLGITLPGSSLTRDTANLGRRGRYQTTPSARAPLVKAFFTSLGESAGEAFRMVLVNDGAPIELSNEPFVLEPLARLSARDVDRELQRLKSERRTTATVLGYCLEFAKQSPPPGMVFRIASEPEQRRFAAARPVIKASRTLFDAGTLAGGKTDSYLDQARQWSIWTLEQRFDETGFRRAFVGHARKNIAGAGRKWTPELERAVTAVTPQRWADIQAILREADTIPR